MGSVGIGGPSKTPFPRVGSLSEYPFPRARGKESEKALDLGGRLHMRWYSVS